MEHGSGCQCSKFGLGQPDESLNDAIEFESLKCFNELVLGSNK